MRKAVGVVVLILLALAYVGLLLVGPRWMILAAIAFFVTVGTGIVQHRRRQEAPAAETASPPSRKELAYGTCGVLALVAIAAMAVLSRGYGVPDLGDGSLLMVRDHYTFTNHGVAHQSERWRFLAVGLIFNTLWFAAAGAAAFGVFFGSTFSNRESGDA